MPRRSLAALEGEWFRQQNAPSPPLPPEPPAYLSENAARHWREIVASKPPTYFDAPNQHFLAMLCGHIATSDLIWRELNKLDPRDAKQFRRYRSLSVMASRESKMTSLMLTKLRLLPARESAASPTSPRLRLWERHV